MKNKNISNSQLAYTCGKSNNIRNRRIYKICSSLLRQHDDVVTSWRLVSLLLALNRFDTLSHVSMNMLHVTITLNKYLPAGLPAYQQKPVEFQLFCLNLISLSNDSELFSLLIIQVNFFLKNEYRTINPFIDDVEKWPNVL